MSKKLNYTLYARRFATRFPVFSYLFTQVFFWMIAYVILSILSHLVLVSAGPLLQGQTSLKAALLIVLFFGFFYGVFSGCVGLFFEKRFHNKALGFIIVGKAVISLIVFIILISVVRSVLYPYLFKRFFNDGDPATLQVSWDAFFYLLLIYTLVAALLISFINQVNKKYGPGVLLPLLLGKYRKPKEEERIFLFMDLKLSTSIAEVLGI